MADEVQMVIDDTRRIFAPIIRFSINAAIVAAILTAVGTVVILLRYRAKKARWRERSKMLPPPLPPGYEESFRTVGPDHDDSIPTCTLL